MKSKPVDKERLVKNIFRANCLSYILDDPLSTDLTFPSLFINCLNNCRSRPVARRFRRHIPIGCWRFKIVSAEFERTDRGINVLLGFKGAETGVRGKKFLVSVEVYDFDDINIPSKATRKPMLDHQKKMLASIGGATGLKTFDYLGEIVGREVIAEIFNIGHNFINRFYPVT